MCEIWKWFPPRQDTRAAKTRRFLRLARGTNPRLSHAVSLSLLSLLSLLSRRPPRHFAPECGGDDAAE